MTRCCRYKSTYVLKRIWNEAFEQHEIFGAYEKKNIGINRRGEMCIVTKLASLWNVTRCYKKNDETDQL